MADSSALVADRRMSSSADLSSPPISPKSPADGDSIVVLTAPSSGQQATSTSTTQPPVKQEPPAKPKRIRKPKIAADGTEITPKPRKSRAKKKDTTDPASTATTTPASISKPVVASQSTTRAPRQSKINELMSPAPPVTQNSTPEIQIKSDPIGNKVEAIQNTKNVESNSSTTQSQQSLQQQTNIKQTPVLSSQPQPVQPSSSSSRGQNYDPIRSSTITALPRSIPIPSPSTPSSTPKPAIRASTSPSIASLMNPSTSSDLPLSRPSSSLSPVKPLPAQLVQPVQAPVPQTTTSPVPTPAMPRVKPPTPPVTDAMEIDAKPTAMSRIASQSSNSAPSPGPSKLREKALVITPKLPPLPGQGFGTTKESGARAIIIDVPLKGETYKCINFQKMAVEKYGFNAVYPKLALQREHLARVAANVAALERKAGATTSNDEMSIDGSDNEAELSTGSKRKAPADTEEPVKKKRLTYEDQYDPEDGFIDDTEATWEQTAAAVQDGFFVYSGDLIQKEEPKPEKADGAAAKRKPRASKGGAARTTAAKSTKDKVDEDKKDAKPTTVTANGAKDAAPKKPAAPRKRYTKEEQAERKAAKEKLAREKAAAAGIVPPPTTTASTTPAVPKTVAPSTPLQAAAVPSPA